MSSKTSQTPSALRTAREFPLATAFLIAVCIVPYFATGLDIGELLTTFPPPPPMAARYRESAERLKRTNEVPNSIEALLARFAAPAPEKRPGDYRGGEDGK